MVDRSASIKSSTSDKTTYSSTSDDTLQASYPVKSQIDKGTGKGDAFYTDKKRSTLSPWTQRTASYLYNKASSAGHSTQDGFATGGRNIRGGLGTCAKGCNAAALFVRDRCSAGVGSFLRGLWTVLCTFGSYYMEILFMALFSMSATLLAFIVAIKTHAPIDPEDLKYSTHGRLSLIMGFCVYMLIVAPTCMLLFKLSGRGSSCDWDYYFWIIFIISGSIIFAGAAFSAGWTNAQGDNHPAGLQCTYGLSTPTARLCEQVRSSRTLLLVELLLVCVAFVMVGIAPVFASG